MRAVLALAPMLVLAACGRSVPAPSVVAPPPVAANAVMAGVALGPALAALSVNDADASGALSSFIESCPRLLARDDASGLTRPEDWRPACDGARAAAPAGARAFFAQYFTPVQIGDGKAFATGYFEPEDRKSVV